jgi:uncharacterized protein YuzE
MRFSSQNVAMRTSYDPPIDNLYVEMRQIPAKRTVEVEGDVLLDVGKDGQLVSHDVHHASKRKQLIARLALERYLPTRRRGC